jgi:formamidopyrimidine-DNA glycosylase
MSGRIDCVPATIPIPIHTHIILELEQSSTAPLGCHGSAQFADPCLTGVLEAFASRHRDASKTHVRLRDPRRFGGLWYYPTLEQATAAQTANLGIDALALTASHLAHWHRTKARLKQRLLSQKDIAGLGNIYIDEALWLARLHPRQRLDRISPAQLSALVKAIRKILTRSIRLGGTTLRDYRNVSDQPGRFAQRLLAYGRAGKPCSRCGTTLQSIQIAARTTVLCPLCQKCR